MSLLLAPPDFAGPLPVRVQEALSLLGPVAEPERAVVLPPGTRLWRLRTDVGNNAFLAGQTLQTRLLQDTEVQSFRPGVVWGLKRGEVSLAATIQSRGGGFLDPILRFWHKSVVPFTDPALGVRPDGQSIVDVREGGARLLLTRSALALTSLRVGIKQPISVASPRVALSWRAGVKLPVTGRRQYLDNGALDLSGGLLWTLDLGRGNALHGALDLHRAGTKRVGESALNGRRWLWGGLLAVERAVSSRDRIVVQYEHADTPFFRAGDAQAGRRRQLSIGAWRRLTDTEAAYLGFSENVFGFDVTAYAPDFMIFAGVTRRW